MEIRFDNYSIAPVHEKDAWRLCDFMVANTERFKADFPETLKANLNPTLSKLFVAEKLKQFEAKTEFLFTLKENTDRTIIGLLYIKELQKVVGRAELAYCIGYSFEGQGITSKMVAHLTSWAFEELKLHTLQIIANELNLGSIRIAQKNGFQFQKALPRSHKTYYGEWVDMQLYERYRKDWP